MDKVITFPITQDPQVPEITTLLQSTLISWDGLEAHQCKVLDLVEVEVYFPLFLKQMNRVGTTNHINKVNLKQADLG